ncbi:hypothetical protein NDU88_004263 [Pleurodeles waltl]|uniref:Uncharacterized protein n=1 Tax=Pleurodeles waltl TaxID=8319 RepID=A0AAV7W4G6_PLEWA|nr:hypothetical protein NDU88_004263 [Pleurodeles waltl]
MLGEYTCFFLCGGRAWCQRLPQIEGRSAGQPGEATTRGRNRGSGRSQGAANKLCAAKDSRGRDPLQGSPSSSSRLHASRGAQ